MKAKILALIIGLGMGLVFCSCEKDLEKYSGTDYIRFVSVFEKDSVDYNFGLAGKTTTDRIGIEVKVTGEVLDYDREYKVKVNPASTVKGCISIFRRKTVSCGPIGLRIHFGLK